MKFINFKTNNTKSQQSMDLTIYNRRRLTQKHIQLSINSNKNGIEKFEKIWI